MNEKEYEMTASYLRSIREWVMKEEWDHAENTAWLLQRLLLNVANRAAGVPPVADTDELREQHVPRSGS